MTGLAQTRADLKIISDVRARLDDIAWALAAIDPQVGSTVSIDEDYKVAEFHRFDLGEMAKLKALVEVLRGYQAAKHEAALADEDGQ